MAIEWSKEYEIGIEKIDRQHFTLVEYINRLEEASGAGSNGHLINTIFQGLMNYTNYHFTFEEIYMKNINYPDLEEHKLMHKDFILKIRKFKTDFESGELPDLSLLHRFLQRWLIEHIREEDKKYCTNNERVLA